MPNSIDIQIQEGGPPIAHPPDNLTFLTQKVMKAILNRDDALIAGIVNWSRASSAAVIIDLSVLKCLMTNNELPKDFAGRVRLFPLPNLVMFPHVVQPLHVFEPRYCELVEDAIATDQLIAMACMRPNWQTDYEGRPPLFPTICVGRIIAHTQLDNAEFNILLLGLRRATIDVELTPQRSFREASVTIQDDHYATTVANERSLIQQELLHYFRRLTPDSLAAQEQFESLMSNSLPLGVLTDIVSFTMELDLELKQRLLSDIDVDHRANALLAALRDLEQVDVVNRDHPQFPPDFSEN